MTRHRVADAAALAAVLAAVVWLWSEPLPALSECGYLLAGYRAAHPELLAGDWTFGVPAAKTLYFDAVFRAAGSWLTIEQVGWAGRLVCWGAIIAGLVAVARRVGVKPVLAWAVVVIWLVFGQSYFGGERPIEHFAPRALAWASGAWAIERYLAGRWVAAGLLLGLAVGSHASVGTALSLAMAAAMVVGRQPLRVWARVVLPALVVGLPGLLPAAGLLSQPGADMRAEWQFQALIRQPIHLDLFIFLRPRIVALLLGLVASAAIAVRRGGKYRDLAAMQIGPALVFLAGVVATVTHRYEVLSIFPFRVLPVVAPFVLLVGAALVVQHHLRSRVGRILLAAVAATALLSPDPRSIIERYRVPPDFAATPERAALLWVREHTPPDAVIVASPARRCTPWLTRRPQIVYGDLARLDRLPEWRERFLALVGPLEPRSFSGVMNGNFDHRTAAEIDTIVLRYGGDFLVTAGSYAYPLLHEADGFRVYDLRGVAAR